jgi:hypothetical protein
MFVTVNNTASTCVKSLSISLPNNQAVVEFNSGSKFLYNNVDWDAMLDLLHGEITSLGKFVNAYCLGNNCLNLA